MSYGTVLREGYLQRRQASLLLTLPVEQVNKLELVINLKTARTLGLKIPQMLAIADEVIE
jgi:hypothetical protein